MATLLETCQAAIEEIGGFDVPSSIFGNSDPDAIHLKRAAMRTGRELEREYKWQVLRTEYTFDTADGTSAYDFPTDIRRFANVTFWSDSDNWPLIKVSNIGWRELNSGINVSGILFYFDVFGNEIHLHPTPTSIRTIDFDYYSKYYANSSGGTAKEEFDDDSDTFRLDDDLLLLGTIFHFLKRKRLPYAEEKAEYLSAIGHLQADDTPKPIIDVARIPYDSGLPRPNFPDGGFGT